MTDHTPEFIKAERKLFEAIAPTHQLWLERYGKKYRDPQTETAFSVWLAARSIPVEITEDMVRRGAEAPIREALMQRGIDPDCASGDCGPSVPELDRAKRIIAAALNPPAAEGE